MVFIARLGVPEPRIISGERMASYRTRLSQDLDRWIAAGLVPAASREALLASVEEPRRVDAATALAVVGALLAGAAVIAFIGANWDGLPRIVRFGLVLGGFAGTAGGAAWAAWTQKPVLTNSLLALAALIYAAAIGLSGQIFDIAGDPQAALRGAGAAAFVLALAGRSSGAAIVALAMIGLGDMAGGAPGSPPDHWRWEAAAAPAGVALAWLWRSRPLAHAAGLAIVAAWLTLPGERDSWRMLLTAVVFGLLAGLARWRPNESVARDLLGWLVVGALIAFALAGAEAGDLTLAHRGGLLLLSAGVVGWGRHDRHDLLTAIGVIGILGTVSLILFDLGLGLMAAAGVFAVCALTALGVGLALRRRPRA